MSARQERPPHAKRSLRRFGMLLAFGCVACIASGSTYLWSFDSRPAPEPSLLAGLPPFDGSAPPEKQAFTARLTARFPVGSREADLVREIWLQGFKPITDLSAQERRAAYETDRHQFNVCVIDAIVSWSADDAGRLTSLSGSTNRGCL